MAERPGKSRKIQDEEHVLDRRLGIKLRVEIWANEAGAIVRFNLAYIDPATFAGDNGRVLGYDNAHGETHRHFRGEVTLLGRMSYEEAAEAFFEEFWEHWKERQ